MSTTVSLFTYMVVLVLTFYEFVVVFSNITCGIFYLESFILKYLFETSDLETFSNNFVYNRSESNVLNNLLDIFFL